MLQRLGETSLLVRGGDEEEVNSTYYSRNEVEPEFFAQTLD